MKNIKQLIALDNPLRLAYHKIRAILANVYYGFPSKGMTIIGITGTNGKTTTTNIVAKGLIKNGEKVFMFSTVNIIMGDEEFINNTKMTSPDVFELQRLLRIAKNKGIKIAIIETASHGIKMNRIWGIDYDIVALTNITQDHLDLHKTMDDYVNTKLEIFKNLIRYERKDGIKKSAIINIDSNYSSLFINETYDSIYTYGKQNDANLIISNFIEGYDYNTFELKIGGKILNIKTKLRGLFNIYNISTAIGIFISLGIKLEKIKELIEDITGVAGRLEEVENNFGFKIFIDYAHTPDALENILQTLNNIKNNNKLICVFGATGDRDRSKRPIMGEVVSRLADKIILTQDDDYTENTLSIIKDVLPGIDRKKGDDFWVINDREEAIITALISANPGDIVVIAGKGDEHVLVTNDGPVKWNDKEKVIEILKGIEENKIV